MLKRLSIGRKLIGLVAVLLFLMLTVAAYSFAKTTWLAEDVGGLSEDLIPLVNALNGVDAQVLAQEVAFERTLRHLSDETVDRPTVEGDLRLFRERGEAVRGAIREAKRQSRDSANEAKTIEDAVELANVRAVLQVLQREHFAYHQLGLEFIEEELLTRGAERTPADFELFRFREGRLVAEVRQLEETLGGLLNDLGAFTAKRAVRVRQDQQSRYVLSLENLGLAGIAFLLGVMVAAITTRRIVRPIRELVSAANRVQDGDLDVEVIVTSEDEVGELATAFNTMVAGLKARERVKEAFGKYLDPRIVDNVIDGISETGGDRQVMTVFFSDLANFSGISETLTPSGLVKIINRYFTLATDPITRHSGVVDKYLGDGIMAFWGPPFTSPEEHAHLACRAALEQFEQLQEFRRLLPELLGFRKGLPIIDIRVGLCTGDLVVGNIGSERAKSFTVMGDTVNIASRLEGVNKQYGTRILIAEETQEQVKDAFELREIDNLMVVGKKEPTRVFELLAIKGELAPTAIELRDAFEAGLAAYRSSDWDRAAKLFGDCREIDSEDGPARVFLDRVQHLRADPPEEGWDGVWRLHSK